MKIGKFDTQKFDARKLLPEVKVAFVISSVLYLVAYMWLTYGAGANLR